MAERNYQRDVGADEIGDGPEVGRLDKQLRLGYVNRECLSYQSNSSVVTSGQKS